MRGGIPPFADRQRRLSRLDNGLLHGGLCRLQREGRGRQLSRGDRPRLLWRSGLKICALDGRLEL